MTLDEILELWEKDSVIDPVDLDKESLHVPYLHGKYLKYLSNERMSFRKLKNNEKVLIQTLTDYYHGDMNFPDKLEQIGKEPWGKRILKSEIPNYIDSDKMMIRLRDKISNQEEKVKILEEILKAINNRNYSITNAIQWRKLTNFGI